MLVLKRGFQEQVILTLPDGRRVTVFVVSVEDGAVKLGFDAPADVVVNRKEVQERADAKRLWKAVG